MRKVYLLITALLFLSFFAEGHEEIIRNFRNDKSDMDAVEDNCENFHIEIDTLLTTPHPYIDSGYYYINACPGQPFHIQTHSRYGNGPSKDANTQFTWAFGDSETSGQGMSSKNYSVEAGHGYSVVVTAQHNSCSATISVRIKTGINPLVLDSLNLPDLICIEDTVCVTSGTNTNSVLVYDTTNVEMITSLEVADTIFLPDGQNCGSGCAYTSPVTFTNFPSGATVTSANDILYVRLSIEHSYVGDIWIGLECPNGQKVSLMKKYNSSWGSSECSYVIPQTEYGWLTFGMGYSYFGDYYEPDGNICNANQNPMGTCWNYCWSNNTDRGYQYNPGSYVYSISNHINGYYLDSSNVEAKTNFFHPDGDFSNLIGCPLNGEWKITVVDGWSHDNGYVCGWEMALDESLLADNRWSYDVNVDSVWLEGEDGLSVTNNVIRPTSVGNTSAVIHTQDNLGCEYEYEWPIQVVENPSKKDTILCCANDMPYSWYDLVCTEAGDYEKFIPNNSFNVQAIGTLCDTVARLHLIVDTASITDTFATVCKQDIPYRWHDKTYHTTGIYNDTIPYPEIHVGNGCDHIVRLHLDTFPDFHGDTTAFVCANDLPFLWYGQECSDPSVVYTHIFERSSQMGCDSIGHLHLSVVYPYNAPIEEDKVCALDTADYIWRGKRLSELSNQGDNRFELRKPCANMFHCDSVWTLHLTINQPVALEPETIAICESYSWHDSTYTESGNYYFVREGYNGQCDTTETLSLSINPPSTFEFSDTSCLSYNWNGQVYDESGDYEQILMTALGCDSIVTLHLTIDTIPDRDTINVVVCESNLPYEWRGQLFDAVGYYSDTVLNPPYCDSTYVLDLQVNPTSDTTLDIISCNSVVLNDMIYDETGQYRDTLINVLGCDSIVILNVEMQKPTACFTIFPPDNPHKTEIALELTDCSESATGWTWIMGNTDTLTEQNPTYMYIDTGTYNITLIVDNDYGCLDTAEQKITVVEPANMYIPNSFTPNGDGINDVFKPVWVGVSPKNYRFEIYNRQGQMVFLTNNLSEGWDGKMNGLWVENATVYDFIIRYENYDGRKFFKKGSVTVLY